MPLYHSLGKGKNNESLLDPKVYGHRKTTGNDKNEILPCLKY